MHRREGQLESPASLMELHTIAQLYNSMCNLLHSRLISANCELFAKQEDMRIRHIGPNKERGEINLVDCSHKGYCCSIWEKEYVCT
ncbi:uncharacterized protein LOC125506128 isoform X2 [Triticum urartu]|uniref:uncharacterized protein LOC125506128 isoform X2 n=1 Tax=Triticum urartu TaxID=4572 RepID=UPI002043F0A6|nr:uncharacterized protein LOC125506128 isoform X2 [Triticum urartu]